VHVKDASLFHGSDCSAGARGGLLDLSPMPVSRKRPRPRSNRRPRSPHLDSARHETFNMAREGEAMKTHGHAKIGNRIRRDLDGALSRLRQLGGMVMVMDRPGTIGESSPFADEVDQIQASASRDISLATRELLQERANRLYSALDRLSVGGVRSMRGVRGADCAGSTRGSPRGGDLRSVPGRPRASRAPVRLEPSRSVRGWRHRNGG
jgi:hypothetical protein